MRLRDIILAPLCILALAAPARADHILLSGVLTGLSEVPPVGTAATGSASIDVDTGAGTVKLVSVQYQGLSAIYTASHIHGPVVPPLTTAGVRWGFLPPAATWTFGGPLFGLPVGDTHAGIITNYFIPSPGLTATDISALLAGNMYVNVHSQSFPGGELRANLLVDRVVPTVKTTWNRVKGLYR